MNEGPTLTYEQPLRPGEARLDVGRESVTIAWRLPAPNRLKIVVGCLVIVYFTVAGVWQVYAPVTRRPDLCGICFVSAQVLFFLFGVVSEIESARRAWVLSANRERLAAPLGLSWYEVVTQMSRVREFAVEAGLKGHVLLAVGHSHGRDVIPWYHLRRRLRHMSLPARLLTHTDPEFVSRAADALNALLPRRPAS